ncbi:MAG TPA: flavin reductase family protein [Roseiarcus sp.]|nr:flavin reductase family protein [Roseiarcus sp.]
MAYLLRQPIEEAAAAPRAAQPTAGEAFRSAMREFASGVAIVAAGQGERRNGCTATSFCSLSIDPPSLVVCLDRASATLATLRSEGAFGVSMLAEAHADLADRFAGRNGLRGAARFAGAGWTALSSGAPLLQGAVATLDCAVEEIVERHTHAIVIGRVIAARAWGGRPLLHWRGRALSP